MMLSAPELVERLQKTAKHPVPGLSIVPHPNLQAMLDSGASSVDLRLGRWFRTMRHPKTAVLKLSDGQDEKSDTFLSKEHFIRFDDEFTLHPGQFVLGITLEWIRLAFDLAGYVTGKSSWGRRGLIIETAAGIHPGFTGCLALELANVGNIPIALAPGMTVCQLFLHEVKDSGHRARSQFIGRRKPGLGSVVKDEFLKSLID
jgi:dCTP deaminase